MKKMPFVLIVICFCCIFMQCRKKNNNDNMPVYQPPFGKLISSIAYYSDTVYNATTYYNYDSRNRLILHYDTRKDSTFYTYTSTQLREHYGGTNSNNDNFYVLKNGLVTLQLTSDTQNYIYNGNGQLTLIYGFSPPNLYDSTQYEYINGNCIYLTDINAFKSIYQYSNFRNSIGNENIGFVTFGNSSNNLPSQLIAINIAGGASDTTLYQYSYEFNADSTVSKCSYIVTQGGHAASLSEVYTYK